MDDDVSPLLFDPQARAEWVHALRNAVNTAGMGMALAERLIEKDRIDDAKSILADSARNWQQCQHLLDQATFATYLPLPFQDSSVSETTATGRHRD